MPVTSHGMNALKSMKKLAAAHVLIGSAASGYFYLSNSVFVDTWRFITEALDNGFPSPLNKEVKDCFSEVLDDLKLENEVKNQFTAFKLPANKLFHAGYPNHKTLIGIPWFFEFDNPYDMTKPAGSWGKTIDWFTPQGERLREAMVLSKNEKKFAIAREICEARSFRNYIYPLIPMSISCMSFALLHYLTTNLPHLQKKMESSKWKKRGFYFAFYSLTLLFCIIIKDGTNLEIEYCADKEVANIALEDDKPTDLTLDYIKAGIEYYNKMLIRNKITKEFFLPKYINWMITDDGDLSQYFRRKHASVLIRKKELEGMLANFDMYGQLLLDKVDQDKRREKLFEERKKIETERSTKGMVNVS